MFGKYRLIVWHQQKCEYKGCTVLRYRATADADMYIQSHGSLDLVTAAVRNVASCDDTALPPRSDNICSALFCRLYRLHHAPGSRSV